MELKPKKDSEGKISYMEINPHFIAAMAARMNANTKYPLFNYKLRMDIEGLLQLVDATERHLADLKCLLQNEPPVHNPTETPLDHLPAIANNAAMIFYQLSKYDFGSGEENLKEIYIKDYILNIFSTNNEKCKKQREEFVKQCHSELYSYVKKLFEGEFHITCDDINVYLSFSFGKDEAYCTYSMVDYEELLYFYGTFDEKIDNFIKNIDNDGLANVVLSKNIELLETFFAITQYHNSDYDDYLDGLIVYTGFESDDKGTRLLFFIDNTKHIVEFDENNKVKLNNKETKKL